MYKGWVMFGAGMHNTCTRLKPTTGWVFKTQTRPIYFAVQVKPNPLGSGWVLVG